MSCFLCLSALMMYFLYGGNKEEGGGGLRNSRAEGPERRSPPLEKNINKVSHKTITTAHIWDKTSNEYISYK